MMNDSLFEYLLIRGIILILHVIGPLCTIYTAYLAKRAVPSLRYAALNNTFQQALANPQWPLTIFQTWCLAETLFFLFFLWYRTYLQAEAVHPPLRSKEERRKLFDQVRSEIHDVEKFLSGWFRGAKIDDIGRVDLQEFLSWAFFDGRATGELEEELEEITAHVEKIMGRQFPAGRRGAKSLRLTLDPIEMEWRSLFWYGIIMGVDTWSHIRLLWYGQKYYWTPETSISVFPPRPLVIATASGRSPAKRIPYWYRPHTSKTRLPVLYLHGIGVGLHPVVDFLHELDQGLNPCRAIKKQDQHDGEVGILSLEFLQISSRITHSIPTRAEFLEELTTILAHLKMDRFVLLSHSYGSVLTTHILTDPALASRVSSTLSIDPVTILLHMPDVAYNFTIRKPRHANEWELWYFASKDPGVAHTLGRHFFWSENVLWRDRIMELIKDGMKMTVSLASRDLIVDTEAVANYLVESEIPDLVVQMEEDGNRMEMILEQKEKDRRKDKDWKQREWKGKGLDVMWWEDYDHAQVFDRKVDRKKLIDVLVEYSRDR